jgi:hypothetical protein
VVDKNSFLGGYTAGFNFISRLHVVLMTNLQVKSVTDAFGN